MKPILFNTEMVRAILDGRKTVTRRVVRPQPRAIYYDGMFYDDEGRTVLLAEMQNGMIKKIPVPYSPGDILYVRETWAHPSLSEVNDGADPEKYLYKADSPLQPCAWGRWHPSIHMPKEAARIFLRVTDVLVERLQDITEEGKTAEGMHPGWQHYNFYELWDSTIKKAELPRYGWDANPWAWVIEFERISKEEAIQ